MKNKPLHLENLCHIIISPFEGNKKGSNEKRLTIAATLPNKPQSRRKGKQTKATLTVLKMSRGEKCLRLRTRADTDYTVDRHVEVVGNSSNNQGTYSR